MSPEAPILILNGASLVSPKQLQVTASLKLLRLSIKVGSWKRFYAVSKIVCHEGQLEAASAFKSERLENKVSSRNTN
jgi:hypothetical protein